MDEKQKFKHWGFVDGIDINSEDALKILEKRMSEFYNQAASNQDYWRYAESANEHWKPETHPYQCHLRTIIEDGSTVIDFGCGSAHTIQNLQEKQIRYIGIEWSEAQVSINRCKYPDSYFICKDITADCGLFETADWALSFFALEHCVRPHLLLQRMFESVKSGGKLAIICPNFIYGMASLRSGFRATTKRDKLRKLQLLDLLYSYYQERFVLPKRVKAIHESSMQFPVYLNPRCLEAPYYSDNDAVYLVRESKVAEYLKKLGCVILHTSAFLENYTVSESESVILYLVAQKPVQACL